MDNLRKFNEIVERVFNTSASTVDDNASRQSVTGWDSFSGLMLVAELEKGFGVTFTASEIDSMQTIGSIKQKLEERNIKFS